MTASQLSIALQGASEYGISPLAIVTDIRQCFSPLRCHPIVVYCSDGGMFGISCIDTCTLGVMHFVSVALDSLDEVGGGNLWISCIDACTLGVMHFVSIALDWSEESLGSVGIDTCTLRVYAFCVSRRGTLELGDWKSES